MTENTLPAATDAVVVPATGQVIDLAAPAAELARRIDELARLADDVANARRELELELIDRLDRRGARTATLEGADLETNAPTTETYDVRHLTDLLEGLVAAGKIDRALVDELVTYPPPTLPVARVDKRVANRLKKSDNTELLRALGAARTVVAQRRTLKVKAIAQDTDAEEVDTHDA